MIGVLLTSTCWYEGITKEIFGARVEELVNSIIAVKQHIRGPYELIIADNSPPDKIPTEKILGFCPERTLFLRCTVNPGKNAGEAMLVRDGLHLSHARGHRYCFKLTGRYFIDGDFMIDDGVTALEASGRKMLAKLLGRPMRDSKDAAGHPLFALNEGNGNYLMGVATQCFITDPAWIVQSGAFQREYLHREIPWVNYEQAFWHCLDHSRMLHWPQLPISGFVGNREMNIPIQLLLQAAGNAQFDRFATPADIPAVDISSLLKG